jgi:hypothetical protein
MGKIDIESAENEKKYQQLSRLGRELRIPITECFLELKVTAPNGRVTHHHRQRSHSWVRNGYNVLTCIMMAINYNDSVYGPGYLNLKAINGTIQKRAGAIIYGYNDPDWESPGCGYMAAAGNLNNGIVVGSGTAAESFEDYSLQTQIAHGTGVGQLSYAQCEAPVKSYDAGTKTYSCTWTRYLNNNSGGDVTVNEVGLIMSCNTNYGYRGMVSRDKLASSVVVASAGQLKVSYTFSVVFPA